MSVHTPYTQSLKRALAVLQAAGRLGRGRHEGSKHARQTVDLLREPGVLLLQALDGIAEGLHLRGLGRSLLGRLDRSRLGRSLLGRLDRNRLGRSLLGRLLGRLDRSRLGRRLLDRLGRSRLVRLLVGWFTPVLVLVLALLGALGLVEGWLPHRWAVPLRRGTQAALPAATRGAVLLEVVAVRSAVADTVEAVLATLPLRWVGRWRR